jgi:hypothetical protein
MEAKVRVEGLEKVLRALSGERWLSILDRFLARLANETLYLFQKTAPKKTGRLVASAYVVSPRAGVQVMRVDAPYAAVVEFGSRPHLIFPRHAQALRFEVGGRVVFARYVRHPGTKAQLIIQRALNMVTRKIRHLLLEVVKNV